MVKIGTSLVVQWLRLCASMQGTLVQSRAGELRSHRPRSATKKKKKVKIMFSAEPLEIQKYKRKKLHVIPLSLDTFFFLIFN